MARTSPICSPEELLSQLARTVALKTACMPVAVRAERPRLAAVARRLAIAPTLAPVGDEDLLCLLAATICAETLDAADDALRCFRRSPYLLLIRAESDQAEGAVAAASALVARRAGWLARDLPYAAGPVLLAPVQRLLDAAALAGEWHGACNGASVAAGEDAALLPVLWRAAEQDRLALAAIAERIESGAREQAQPQTSRERDDHELARLRSAERREADRLRMLLMEERAWVAEQAMRVAASNSWRIGHRLTRLARLLTFRPDRGTNLPEIIAARMEETHFS